MASATEDIETTARRLVIQVPHVLAPIIERGKRGEFEPEPGPVDGDAIGIALLTALAIDVETITFVSLERDPAPRWADDGLYERTLASALEQRFGYRLLMELGQRKWNTMRRHFGFDRVVPFCEHLRERGVRIPRENLRQCLFIYYGCTFAFDGASVDRLTPLIELLPRAIPLGERKGEPGNWIVLTA
jgi:hypothetical protein